MSVFAEDQPHSIRTGKQIDCDGLIYEFILDYASRRLLPLREQPTPQKTKLVAQIYDR